MIHSAATPSADEVPDLDQRTMRAAATAIAMVGLQEIQSPGGYPGL